MLVTNYLLAALDIWISFSCLQAILSSKTRKIPLFCLLSCRVSAARPKISAGLLPGCILPHNFLACLPVHLGPMRKSVKKCFVVCVVQVPPNFKGDSSVRVGSSNKALEC